MILVFKDRKDLRKKKRNVLVPCMPGADTSTRIFMAPNPMPARCIKNGAQKPTSSRRRLSWDDFFF